MTRAAGSPAVTRQRRPAEAPLTPGQERIWFLEHMVPGTAAYVLFMPARLRGRVDTSALRRSVLELTRRHTILRSAVAHASGGGPALVEPGFGDDVFFAVRAVDPARTSLTAALSAEACVPFSLAHGPLFAAVLFTESETKHALLLKFHHAICDGWSLGVFLAELSELYAAFHAGQPSPLGDPPLQFSDYAMSIARGCPDEAALRFWTDQLRDAPALLALPADWPRPAIQSFRGMTLTHHVSPALGEAVARWCARRNMTRFTGYLTALEILLHRYTNQATVLVGTPAAGRATAELEAVIGFFVNTVVLRADISPQMTGADLAAQQKKRALDAMAHQHVPFERIVDDLGTARTTAHNPVFQVLFAWQNAPGSPLVLPGLQCQAEAAANETSKFDLSVHVIEDPAAQSPVLGFEYSSDLFRPDTIERLCSHYLTLLRELAVDDSRPVSMLPIMAQHEVGELLAVNDTAHPQAQGTIWDMVTDQARRAPDSTAITEAWPGGRTVTYRELMTRVEHLAAELTGHGLARGAVAAVRLSRSADLVVAVLAVMRSAGVYCPVKPDLPEERIAFLLEDSQAALRIDAGGPGEPPITVRPLFPAPPAARPRPESLTARDPAYLIYTSGSTGRPKGVLVSHGGLANRLAWMRHQYAVTAQDRVLHKTTISFDVSVWELLLPAVSGATVVLLPPGAEADMQQVADTLARQRVTIAHFVPSALAAFLDLRELPQLPFLRHVICSGEALPKAVADDFRARQPGRLHNLYGPTEAAIDVTACECADDSPSPASVPIGRPVWNTQVFVLDWLLNLVPPGIAGELYLGGAQLALGYARRPALTAERFVAAPAWTGLRGQRLYRTGDLVRVLPDGSIDYLGRTDDQVKIRGHRIEPGEIEHALRQCPLVADAAVVAFGPPDQRQLAAFLTPASATASPEYSDQERLSQWRHVWQSTYRQARQADPADPAARTDGWVSSYTGAPFTPQEMQQYRADVESLLDGAAAGAVLDVGCGAGQLLRDLFPRTAEYWAADPSEEALAAIRDRLGHEPGGRLVLLHRAAHELGGLPRGHFDVVLLASVMQYFPSLQYARRVLHDALALVRPGGRLIVADVRNHDLARAYYAEAAVSRLPPGVPVRQLQAAIDAAESAEAELFLSPGFFAGLPGEKPGIGTVEVRLKRGQRNELSAFRFNVIICKPPAGGTQAAGPPPAEADSEAALWAALAAGDAPVIVRRRGNARVHGALTLLQSLGEPQPHRLAERSSLADPEQWRRRAAAAGWTMTARYAGPGHFDAVFWRTSPPAALPPLRRQEMALANDPLAGARRAMVREAARHALQAALPDYMIPATFTVVSHLMTTPSGKVDRAALAGSVPPPRATASATRPPATKVERALAAIWADVLDCGFVGADDDFFELGGDSIRSVRVASRAAEQGIALTVRQIFEHPTVAGLATVAQPAAAGAAAAALPLLPAQRAQLSAATPPLREHTLTARRRVDPALVSEALGHVVRVNDALRLDIETDESGGLCQRVQSDLTGPASPRVRISPHPAGGLALQTDDLSVDRRSLRLLTGALAAAYEALAAGETATMPAPKVTYADFCREAERLLGRGRADLPGRAHSLRGHRARHRAAGLGFGPAPRPHLVSDEHLVVSAVLGAFTQEGRHADVFVARDLRQMAGSRLGPGAAEVIAAATYARRLPLGRLPAGIAERIADVKTAFAHMDEPGHTGPAGDNGPGPRVSILVSIAGRAGAGCEPGLFAVQENICEDRTSRFDAELDVDIDGEWLTICWGLADTIDERTARRLRQAFLRQLRAAAAAVSRHQSRFVASDFPLARLDGRRLAELSRRWPDAEDVYPAGPLQQHLISHYGRDPRHGLNVIWVRYTLAGLGLDVPAFAGAWHDVMRRHPALRTSFAWTGSNTPCQVVHKNLDPQFSFRDLRDLGEAAQEQVLRSCTEEIRRRRPDLEHPPLWNLALFQTGADTYAFVAQYSYLLQDGWSYWIFIDDLFAFYEARRCGQTAHLPPSPPYRDHIRHIATDAAGHAPFWRAYLAGASLPTPIVPRQNAPGHPDTGFRYRCEERKLPGPVEARLRSFARGNRLTLFTVFEAAWAVIAAALSGHDDVVVGIVSSGRSPDLRGVESMTGSFNNIVPVRTGLRGTDDLLSWLRRLQSTTRDVREHEQTSLPDICSALGLPPQQLFESYLVFENFPPGERMDQVHQQWQSGPDDSATQTEHALRVLIWPFGELVINISFYDNLFSAAQVRRLMDLYFELLDLMSRRHAGTPGALRDLAISRLSEEGPDARLEGRAAAQARTTGAAYGRSARPENMDT